MRAFEIAREGMARRQNKVKVKLVVTIANMGSRADMGIDLDCLSCLSVRDILRTSTQHAGSRSTSNQDLSALISLLLRDVRMERRYLCGLLVTCLPRSLPSFQLLCQAARP